MIYLSNITEDAALVLLQGLQENALINFVFRVASVDERQVATIEYPNSPFRYKVSEQLGNWFLCDPTELPLMTWVHFVAYQRKGTKGGNNLVPIAFVNTVHNDPVKFSKDAFRRTESSEEYLSWCQVIAEPEDFEVTEVPMDPGPNFLRTLTQEEGARDTSLTRTEGAKIDAKNDAILSDSTQKVHVKPQEPLQEEPRFSVQLWLTAAELTLISGWLKAGKFPNEES